ncbi:MAG: penicillin-binding protein 2 [Candidatus Brocadiia bacterium]
MTAATDTERPRAGRPLRVRATMVVTALLFVFALLVARLAQLQIADADFYRRYADRQQILTQELSARRGHIFDRKGRLLATSVQRYSVYADPKAVTDPDATAAILSELLDVSRRRLREDLRKDRYFVWVKRQIPDRLAERVRSLGLRGVHMRRESKRLYPQGRLAAHVIGFTDIDGRGLAGVERTMDALLRGRPGLETVLCDGGRRIFRSELDKLDRKPFAGLDVRLSLDAYVQEIAEQELAKACEKHAPECGAAVVLDARDGGVLAMASQPSFDPQAPAATPVAHQRNIAISDAYEFGSVMKPFPIAAALDGGIVTPETEFDCHNGLWQLGARTLHDAHEYGVLDVSSILCHSSNIGAAQIAMELGKEGLYAGIRNFGFGRPTGIALPGETGGIVRPLRTWNRYSVVSVSFGQELAVTPLAVARAFTAFANQGVLVQPRIIESVTAGDGEVVYAADEPMVGNRAVGPTVAAQVLRMLRRVVTEGTGRNVKMEEYPVAGKTGTAQLLREDGRGYSEDRYLSNFAGLAPYPDCRIVVLVCLKNPTKNGYYGGTAAAPAVREIIRRTLRYMQVPAARRGGTPDGESV